LDIYILVVDDNGPAREAVETVLESAGYVVTTASGGEEGMVKFRERPADLVITDIMMPNKDGIELMREIRNFRPDAKILAVSGYPLLQTVQRLGADATLAKPFDCDDLLASVAICLAG
jgi:two-component system, chemotaxis family, chemotaxis protein CheY